MGVKKKAKQAAKPKTPADLFKASLEKCTAVIAAERDKLREIESCADELADVCDDTIESLKYAVQTLSRLV